jgi:N-methylhydantoinase A
LTINSGPSMAPLAGAASAPDADVVVVCDMGGTTFDVSLVEQGRVRHTREAWLGEPFVGHLTGLSSVAVQSIGAGGGSIAWIDSGGLLRVGPQSARSDPGPAAYGRGGTLPTVTDACVVLGYLNADTFEAGFRLDRDAAERAVARQIGGPLGLSAIQAAQAIVDVSANHMSSAIRQVTLEHGVDPRGALIVAGGGAGAMVAAALADLLEARQAVIPSTAGVLAAYGAHEAPIATEFTASHYAETSQFDAAAVAKVLADLDVRAAAFLARFETRGASAGVSYFVDARYPAQAWDLRVHLEARPPASDEGARMIAKAFHREHLHRNGTEDPDSRIEILAWGLRAEIAQADGHLAALARPSSKSVTRTDDVVFDSRPERTLRYTGGSLSPKQVISGPAIVDEPTTTVVIPPGWTARLDEQRNFHLQRDREAA